jgi:hypothetical protein
LCFNDYTKERDNAIFNEKLKVHISPSSFRSTSFINTILLTKKEEVINKNLFQMPTFQTWSHSKGNQEGKKGAIMWQYAC